MPGRWGRAAVLLALLACLCDPSLSTGLTIKESMGDRGACEKYADKILWISGKTNALISGRTEDTIDSCQLKFGLASNNPEARLRLKFDFLYIDDCGVQMQVNQSTVSNFTHSKTNREMFMSECKTKNPGALYAQPKNFVLISLKKDSKRMEAYNFRLNISMAESLPETGPDLHVVIIVGFVLVVVVLTAAVLLIKWLMRLTYSWREQRSEEAMARAITIYNSLEPSEEPDLVYLTPGNQSHEPNVSNGHQSNRGQQGAAEIAFVHSDGRIERFRPRDAPSGERSEGKSSRKKHQVRLPEKHSHSHEVRQLRNLRDEEMGNEEIAAPRIRRDVHGEDGPETASLAGCDMPPSYEEALEMPRATREDEDDSHPDTRLDIIDQEDEDGVAVRGTLELDYLNVNRDNQQ